MQFAERLKRFVKELAVPALSFKCYSRSCINVAAVTVITHTGQNLASTDQWMD